MKIFHEIFEGDRYDDMAFVSIKFIYSSKSFDGQLMFRFQCLSDYINVIDNEILS